MREQHERDAPNVDSADPAQAIPIQVSVEYSDASGNVLVKKVQAEPDASTAGYRTVTVTSDSEPGWVPSGALCIEWF